MTVFVPYDVHRNARPFLRLIGFRADRDGLRIDDDTVTASFGPFHVRTDRANVSDISRTGPYSPFKVLGPRLSLADRGLTFGTNWQEGLCLQFHEPIGSAFGPFDHPGLTLTLSDVGAAVDALRNHP